MRKMDVRDGAADRDGRAGRADRARAAAPLRRAVCAALGVACLGLGALGVVVPILPTVPFLMAAAFLFARSSARLDAWFRGTALYAKYLEGYVAGRGMSASTKVRIMVMVTLLLSVGFALMGGAPVGRAVLVIVWLGHVAYFVFGVKTAR